jgi:hypothetical protein
MFHNSVGIIAECFLGHDTSRGRLYNEFMNEDELIALAAHEGYVISPRQLERWHKADLIPRPEVIPPLTFGGEIAPSIQIISGHRYLRSVDTSSKNGTLMPFASGFG